MYVIASFDYSFHLELAISELVEKGLKKTQILAVPLDKREEKRNILDTIHHADGISLFDGGAVLGTILMVFGVIYGFVWEWGPIIWGLIGLIAGFVLGILLDMLFSKTRPSKGRQKDRNSEVFIIVDCNDTSVELVKEILWGHLALGLAVVG